VPHPTGALVSTAADLADEIGFGHLTLSALAMRCGVRDASLYTHIRGLADLQERVAMLALGEWADALGAAIAGRSGRTALGAFADAYRTLATGHPGRYAATRHPVLARATRRVRRRRTHRRRLLRAAARLRPVRT
jgi:AcrR family transcriptional regulator